MVSKKFSVKIHSPAGDPQQPKAATMRAYKILGAVQHYDWGKVGSSSKVAQFYSRQSSTPIDETKPYAGNLMDT